MLAHIATSKVCAIIEPTANISRLRAICLCNRGCLELYVPRRFYPRIVSGDTSGCGETDVAVQLAFQ